MLAFQNALDDVDGHIKSGDDPCKIYLNLVGSKSGVNATQLSTAGVDRHSSWFICVRYGVALPGIASKCLEMPAQQTEIVGQFSPNNHTKVHK